MFVKQGLGPSLGPGLRFSVSWHFVILQNDMRLELSVLRQTAPAWASLPSKSLLWTAADLTFAVKFILIYAMHSQSG